MNLSCWGRCDEPCGEGAAARVRTPQGGHPPLPRHRGPKAAGAAAAPPPTPAPLPGPVFTAPGAAPALASCPRLSQRSRGGWVRPESLVPRHPQAVGVRLKARPWRGAGCALYRASKAPGGGAL